MTAISLAESGGNSRARNPHGEDSRGLWQINGRAHPDLLGATTFTTRRRTRKRRLRCRKGGDISPWTVTHGGNSALSAAQGGGPERGRGARGRRRTGGLDRHPRVRPRGAAAGSGRPAPAPRPRPTPGTPRQPTTADTAVPESWEACANRRSVRVRRRGLGRRRPEVFDCSEFTQWAAHQAGVKIPDGATSQYLWSASRHADLPVRRPRTPRARCCSRSTAEPRSGDGRTPGAHVAISLGDGKAVEAANGAAGVRDRRGGRFEYAAVIPGISALRHWPPQLVSPGSRRRPLPVALPVPEPSTWAARTPTGTA